jgi:ferric-dicitrate binding protein FerR (iron transport regulator)
MINKNYPAYSVEELLDDSDFIRYVLLGDRKNDWESLLANHPGLADKAGKARKIIEVLHDAQDNITEDEILDLWKKIEHFDAFASRSRERRIIRSVLKYAAVLFLVFSTGVLLWYVAGTGKSRDGYRFSESVAPETGGDARLILHDREEISLEKENSKVEINASGEIVINQEQIVTAEVSGQKKSVPLNEVIVPYGRKTQLLLADGTKVWLNAGSRLAFPIRFDEATREVYLEGEACFEVAKVESQPFFVRTGQLDVKVTGTYFDVIAYPADHTIETILMEGKVVVERKRMMGFSKEEIHMVPGQKASFNKETKDITVLTEPNIAFTVGWIEGWFEFSDESLKSVFTKLERYYNIRIEVPHDFVSGELITGKLDLKDSLEAVLAALADVGKFGFRRDSHTIYVDRKTD